MKHDNAFDALRLFAALLVIFGHAFRLTGEPGLAFAGNGIATTGVKIFFVVSGYLVAQSWLRDPHFGRFMRRRLLRIVPGLAAVVVLTAFALGPAISNLPVSAYFADQRSWAYLANLVFYPADELPGVFGANIAPNEVNGSLWSLPPEMSMYLVLPITAGAALALTGAYRLFAVAAILFTLVALLAVTPSPGLHQWLVYGTRVWAWFSVAPYFLIGACYTFCGWQRLLNRGVALLLLALLVVTPAVPVLTELLLVAALPYIVLAFGNAPAPGGGALTARGDFSYGLYLYAFPIQQALVATVGTPGGGLGNFFIASILAGACAALSWHFVEKPALRAKPVRLPSQLPLGNLKPAEIA
jgi:peptidoglycan/LPS O-acetylase OafA/YrhL